MHRVPLILFLSILMGCASSSSTRPHNFKQESSRSVFLPSEETETKMGHATDALIQQEFVLLDDSEIGLRVDAITGRLLERVEERKIDYRFHVLNHNDLNAFSAPGGYVYITYGLLRLAESEEEVAAILAHEIAHVENRHQMKSYRSAQTAQLLLNAAAIGLSLSTGGDASSHARQLGPLGALIVLNTFSRFQETEADDDALYLLRRAGYNPSGLWTILERIYEEKEKGKWQENVPSIFLTHPPTLARIKRIRDKTQTEEPPPRLTVDEKNKG